LVLAAPSVYHQTKEHKCMKNYQKAVSNYVASHEASTIQI